LEGIAENDRISRGEIPEPQRRCEIDDHEGWHICGACLATRKCKWFAFSQILGFAVCSACTGKLNNNPAFDFDKYEYLLKARLTGAVRRDNRRTGDEVSLRERVDLVEVIWKELVRKYGLPNDEEGRSRWKDSYVDQILLDRGEILPFLIRSASGRVEFMICTDE
jgi:hypothetical protein